VKAGRRVESRPGPARGGRGSAASGPAGPAGPAHPGASAALRPSEQRALTAIQAELRRLVRYDDESIVHENWIRQRYDCGCFPGFASARSRAVETAWHEAGHAVAALAVGAHFRSASIRHSCGSDGRVHGITGAAGQAFVIDAAGQVAQRLRTWTMLERDADLLAWLPTWTRDGGDARRFRRSVRERLSGDELGAWRQAETLLTARRLQIRQVARALLIHPRHLPHAVVAAVAETVGR
jgi:hypothetical protein